MKNGQAKRFPPHSIAKRHCTQRRASVTSQPLYIPHCATILTL
jgi:hypothetical protein